MGQRDVCLKRYLNNEERFADLINGIMGEGDRLVSAGDLTDMDSQVGPRGWDRINYRDLIKKAAFGVNFMVIGIENQEHTNYLMPLRCFSYDAKEYERQAAVEKSFIRRWKKMRSKEENKASLTREEFLSGFRKESKLHPCITVVLYFGEEWDAATHLYELLDFSGIPKKLHRYVNDYNIAIIPVRKLKNTEVFRTDIRLVFDCIRYANDKQQFRSHILKNPEYANLDEDAYDVIERYTNVLDDNKITIDNKLDGGKVDMCKAMKELMAEERAEGKAEGKAEGRRDMIFELLNELGSLSEELIQRIRTESNLQVLSVWNRLAACAESVQEFEMKM